MSREERETRERGAALPGGVRAALLASSACALLLFLGLDEAGRVQYASPKLAGPARATARLVVEAPPGTYDVFLRVGLRGPRERIGFRSPAGDGDAILRSRGSTTRDVPIARSYSLASRELAVEVSSGGPGRVEAVVLEPGSPLPPGRDALQRLCLALAVLLFAIGAGTGRRGAAAILAAAALPPALRCLAFGLVPFEAGDLRGQFYPWYVHSARELAAGRIPLWNPGAYLGLPHLANQQTQLFHPPVALSLLLGASFPHACLAWMLGHALLAGGGALLLARGLGIPRAGALVAALVFMTSPAMIGPRQPSIVATTAFFPWMLWALLRGRGIAVRVALLGFAFLAGHLQYFTFGLVAVALQHLAPARAMTRRELLRRSATTLPAAMLLGAVVLLPLLETAAQSVRGRGLSRAHASLGPTNLLEPALLAAGARHLRSVPRIGSGRASATWIAGPAAGCLAAVALVAALRGRHRRATISLLLLGAGGLAIAMGDVGDLAPYTLLWRSGLLSPSRGPGRLLCLVSLAMALLAGLGADALVAGARGRGARVAALLAGLVAAERLDDAWCAHPLAWPAEYQARPRISRPPGEGNRELAVVPFRANDALLTGRRGTWGYDPVIPMSTALYWNRIHPMFDVDAGGRMELPRGFSTSSLYLPGSVATLRAMGVETIAAERRPATPLPPGMRLRRHGSGPPRVVVDGAARAHVCTAPAPDAHARAGIDGAAWRACVAEARPDDVRVVDEDAQRVRLLLREPSRAGSTLVLSDAWFPGWRARAGGAERTITSVDGALRGIELRAGDREVMVSYEPFSYRLGLFLTLATSSSLLGSLAICDLRSTAASRPRRWRRRR